MAAKEGADHVEGQVGEAAVELEGRSSRGNCGARARGSGSGFEDVEEQVEELADVLDG